MKYKVLYNPLSGNGNTESVKAALADFLKDCEHEFVDVTTLDLRAYLESIGEDYALIIAGGDGTLNRFINAACDLCEKRSVLYYAAGNGNDFLSDLGGKRGDAPVCIDEYIKDLPQVTVNGKDYKVLNGVGYGIDGYCCEVGDALKAAGKKVNYTSIAIKGLLFKYKPCNAEVTVDGVTKRYKKVWIAPCMNGRYYGGGMIPTPAQNRLDPERKITLCVMYGKGKIRTLTVFPTIFKGEHVKKTNMVDVISGHEVKVKFDRPTALQIDGETILGVSEYVMKK